MTRDTVFGRRREGRVLVVQDDPHDRGPMTTKLAHAGYEVLEAEDGQEAIYLLQRGDNPFLVDTILCDVTTARQDGEATVRYFRTHYPAVPVIVLSQFPNLEMAVTLLKLGVADYLARPIAADEIVEAVKHTIKQRVP